MPTNNSVADYINAWFRSEPVPMKMDENLYKDIHDALEKDEDGKLLRVRPFPENEGMQASEELFQALHNLRTKFSFFNNSQRFGFEMWFNEGSIQFFFYVRNEQQEEKVRRQLDAHYPNSDIVEESKTFPPIYEDDWVAGAELYLKQSKYYPIKNPKGVRQFQTDPYRSITSDLISRDTDRVCVQYTFRPAMGTWTHGGKLGYINPLKEDIYEVAEALKAEQKIPDGTTRDVRNPTSEERQLSERIARQEGQPAYHTDIRIYIFSNEKSTAKNKIRSIGQTYQQLFKEAGGQSFVYEATNGVELKRMLKEAAQRRVFDHEMVFTIPEVSTVAHIPNQNIETPAVDWNQTQATARIPSEAERFGEEDGHGEQMTVEEGGGGPNPNQPTPTVDDAEEQPDAAPGADPAAEPPGQPGKEGEEPDPWAEEQQADPDPWAEDEPDENWNDESHGSNADDPWKDEPEPSPNPSNEQPQGHGPQEQPPQDPDHARETQTQNQPPQRDQNPPQGRQQRQDQRNGAGQNPPQQQGQQNHQSNHQSDRKQFNPNKNSSNEPVESEEGGFLSRITTFIGFEDDRGFQSDDPEPQQPPRQQGQQGQQGQPQQRQPPKRQDNQQGSGQQQPRRRSGPRGNTSRQGHRQNQSQGTEYPDSGTSSTRTPRSKSGEQSEQKDNTGTPDPNEPRFGSNEKEKMYEEQGEEPTIDDVQDEFDEEFEDEIEDAWNFDPEEEPEDK